MIEKNKLKCLYWNKKFSQREISQKLDCSRSKVKYWMNKHDIKTRANFSGRSIEKLDEKTLRKYYKKKNWSQKMIAEKFGCCRRTVGNRLKKFNIEKRDHSKCIKIAYEEDRRKVPQMTGKDNPYYGKKHDENAKRKMRVSAMERLKRQEGHQLCPNYNPKACELIEEYGDEHGYDFQHAENGGEIFVNGYWLDGYDENQNVAIEVDEPYHYNENGELREKDKRRQQEIEENLNCEFIRLKINSSYG